jgi:hypothetical protein
MNIIHVIYIFFVNIVYGFLNFKKQNIIKSINGFYGLIGPDIKTYNLKNYTSLDNVFSGNGVIQGVFFDKGKISFVKHLINTEKVIFEKKYGIIPKDPFILFIFFLLNKINLLPNLMGVSNTAFININEKIYTLFERDYPYLIDINFKDKTIKTIGKQKIDYLEHFSAHSKYCNNIKIIETIDYKMNSNIINYFKLNTNFKELNKLNIKLKYIPIIHDFYSDNNKLIIIDSPLTYDFKNIFSKQLPIFIDKKKKTYVYIVNKLSGTVDSYCFDEAFYIFHYVNVKEDNKYIKIYVCVYNSLDFNSIDFEGKYRLIQINKLDNTTHIYKNNEIEKFNLDFPIKYEDKYIMINTNNKSMNGFIIVKDLLICKKIFFENKNICGEQKIIYIKNIPYLIFFNVEKNKSLLSLINLKNYDIIDIDIPEQLNLGFHSIFLHNTFTTNSLLK